MTRSCKRRLEALERLLAREAPIVITYVDDWRADNPQVVREWAVPIKGYAGVSPSDWDEPAPDIIAEGRSEHGG